MNYDKDNGANELSLAETAYQSVKRDIIRCDLEPGRQITEQQLAKRYDVSRAVVRPAIKRLYQQQLIQTISRQRYVVSPVTLKEANDLFELRLLIEPPAARKAAGRLRPSQIERLEQLSRVQYQVGDRESAEAFLEANVELHVLVARASGNDMLTEMVGTLLEREQRLNHLSHMLRDRNNDATNEHRDLLDALAIGDGERAEQVMKEGIQSARRFVLEALMTSPSIQSVNVFSPPAKSSRAT